MTVAGVADIEDVRTPAASIVTSFEALDVDEIELPEVAPVPLALPVKLTVPADPAVYVHVNVALPPAAMLADAGDDPVAVPVLVPPNVRDDGVTLFTCSPPVLLTVITTVMVWPGVTVAGVADIEDVRTPKGVEIVTLFEVVGVEDIGLFALRPLALPVKLTVPADPAVYVHVNVILVFGGMFLVVGSETRATEPVPSTVRERATLLIAGLVVLFTVMLTVIVSPTLTVAGVADIDDVKLSAANTKLEKKVNNKTNTNPIEIILPFIKITGII